MIIDLKGVKITRKVTPLRTGSDPIGVGFCTTPLALARLCGRSLLKSSTSALFDPKDPFNSPPRGDEPCPLMQLHCVSAAAVPAAAWWRLPGCGRAAPLPPVRACEPSPAPSRGHPSLPGCSRKKRTKSAHALKRKHRQAQRSETDSPGVGSQRSWAGGWQGPPGPRSRSTVKLA